MSRHHVAYSVARSRAHVLWSLALSAELDQPQRRDTLND
jgi:hypothetical protein